MPQLMINSFLLSVITLFSISVYANVEDEPADISTRSTKFHINYYVNDDLTHTTHYDLVTKVLDERAIQSIKSSTISYSASIEQVEILEAYNLKASGEKISVPETNYQQRVNSGKDSKGPVFSDRASLTVVFPDLEVGDSAAYSYNVSQTEPMFPGQFSVLNSFPSTFAYDDVQVTLNVPSNLKAKYQVREMSESIQKQKNRTIYTWRYQNPAPKKDKRKDFSVWDLESNPGFIYSTFSSYQDIVNAYAERAIPKAAETDEIRSLAKDIVGEVKAPKEKAQLLYEWVAKNITYAGHCIGVGAVVPHDISFILDNRMGDCKDQATILQALLSAEGIQSTQALINAGSIYSLPEIPTVTAVNHVINYLPDFDIFVDATSETVPFGLIPFSIQDKPILLVDGYEKGARTPASEKLDIQRVTSVITIDEQGNATGKVGVALEGLTAAYIRSSFRHSTPNSENEWLKGIFSHDGYPGFGSLTKEDPMPMMDSFDYQVDFNIQQHIPLYGLAAFKVYPLLPTDMPIYSLLDAPQEIDQADVACSPATSDEKYTYQFPENIQIIATPEDSVIEGASIYYQAHYKIDGNTLEVHRILEDKTKGNICSPEFMVSQKEVIQKILWDVNSQIVYKVRKN